jgi:signal transduction histidine kinase
MRIYQILSRFPLLKKYSYKFLFIAFLGIHVPLIGTIIYMVFGDDTTLTHENIILMVLSFTLIATAATLFVLNQLLEPLIIAKNALEAYIQSRALPSLPVTFKDEAGVLMQKVQTALMSMDEFVQAKKDMVTLLSHDLRSPIARTLGLAELLKSDLPWSEAQEYIELIRQENKNQLALLDYILEQLRHEQLEITEDKKEYINLKELVQRSINTLSSIISQKNLEITVDLPEKFKVRVEKILFGQVILNLLHNACKFSFPNGKIHFETKSHNNLTHIQIKDQGIGFYQSGIEKYFQRFTDFGQQGTAGEKSTGIGLYLSRRIIERHSGSLKGKSDGPNKGATFEIVIPE